MNKVTDLILITGIWDKNIEPINNWLIDNCNGQQLNDLTKSFGGSKVPQLQCWGGTIKDLRSINYLIDFIMNQDCTTSKDFKLIYQEEESKSIEIFELTSIKGILDRIDVDMIKRHLLEKYNLQTSPADDETWLDLWLEKLENRTLLQTSLQKIELTLAPIPR